MSDILVIGHPVVDRMLEALSADRDRFPTADMPIVDELAKLDGFAFDGLVVTIHGVRSEEHTSELQSH